MGGWHGRLISAPMWGWGIGVVVLISDVTLPSQLCHCREKHRLFPANDLTLSRTRTSCIRSNGETFIRRVLPLHHQVLVELNKVIPLQMREERQR